MERRNLFTWPLFQFYTLEIRTYAFGKFLDFYHISSFHGLLAQAFDKFSDTADNKIEDLK